MYKIQFRHVLDALEREIFIVGKPWWPNCFMLHRPRNLDSDLITITGEGDNLAAKRENLRNKGVILKICAPFTDCISETNYTQIHNAKDIDVVVSMYSLI